MFSAKSLLVAVSAAVLAQAYNGTAILGFYGTTSCGCPPWNGPYAVAIPRDLVGTETCCNVGVTVTWLDSTIDAVFSGYYEDGAGTEGIALSAAAFAALGGFPDQTAHFPVTWSFDN
ncbi:hypothetical protein C8R46DRAFT_1094628 [Mycena filopes]|nr:hypothetical protein C8R46DRAFT_1094628 [Mycena filopes]